MALVQLVAATNADTGRTPTGIYRGIPITPERYNARTESWVYYPEIMRSIWGLGGACETDYWEVTEEFVNECIDAWKRDAPAPLVPRDSRLIG